MRVQFFWKYHLFRKFWKRKSAWKVSKYGGFSGLDFPVIGKRKYCKIRTRKTTYLDTFHAVIVLLCRACSIDTESFMQPLQQFIARRGSIRVQLSDNGSNFVEVQKELGNTFKEMDHQKIQYFLQNIGADNIVW